MSKYIPYFAAFILILFGIGFYSALQAFKKMHLKDRADSGK